MKAAAGSSLFARPDPPAPPAPNRPHGWVIAVGAIAAAWLLFFLGPLSFLFPGVLVGLLAARRWGSAVLCLLVSPIGVSFFGGVVAYSRGTALLQSSGLPGTEFHNLDPVLRCGRSSSGCLVHCNEWMTQLPNNLAVETMTRMFGPQPGAYTGSYPTEAEAKMALAGASDVDAADVAADTVQVATRSVRLDRGVGAGLLRAAGPYFDAINDPAPAKFYRDEAGPIRAVLWKDACLIVRIPTGAVSSRAEPVQRACIAVIDLATGRPFAYYAEGSYYHRFPPVPWRP